MSKSPESDKTNASAPADEAKTTDRTRVKDALFTAIDETVGYKATQLAEAAGVTHATLSAMRHHGRDVRISTFQRLLDAMPADVYLRYYRHLGTGLGEDMLSQQKIPPVQLISALLPLCDDQSLLHIAREVGELAKERYGQGSEIISALALLIELMQYCELEDIPALIDKVGKYTSTAISRAASLTPNREA